MLQIGMEFSSVLNPEFVSFNTFLNVVGKISHWYLLTPLHNYNIFFLEEELEVKAKICSIKIQRIQTKFEVANPF